MFYIAAALTRYHGVRNKSSAVAEMGDRLATIDMGGKLEAVPLSEGGLHGSPSNTMWPGPSDPN